LGHHPVGITVTQQAAEWVRPLPSASHGDAAHRFDARSDDDIVRTGRNTLRRKMHCLLTGAALAIDCRGWNVMRESCGEQSHPPRSSRLLSTLAHTADDDIVDAARI
jgi:hypothetical protein